MTPSERRRYRRVKAKGVSGHVRVKDQVLALGLPIDNISMGGLFVRCSNPLPIGTPVLMELQSNVEAPLKLVGTTVVSVDTIQAVSTGAVAGMGIRFEPLGAEVSKRLSGLLTALANERVGKSLAPKAAAAVSPLTDEVVRSREAFDFGFVSLSEPVEEGSAATPNSPSIRRGELKPLRRVTVTDLTRLNDAPALTDAAPVQTGENARLMVQVRGLLFDLDATKEELARRSKEIEFLRAELERAHADIGRKAARIARLEELLARNR